MSTVSSVPIPQYPPNQQSISLPDRIASIKRALKAEELAEILNVSRITILKQAKAGRIPSFRVGSCVRFDPKALSNWLRKQ